MSDFHLTAEQLGRLSALGKETAGLPSDALHKALTQDDWSGLQSLLSAEDTAKVRAVWQDKEKLNALLQDPAVRQLLEQLGGRHG